MEMKTKSFDAVAESRRWREVTSRKLDAMSLEARLDHLEKMRELFATGRKQQISNATS